MMPFKHFLAAAALLLNCCGALSQSVKELTSGTKTSMRGLSVVTDKIVWASGSGGMVARSTDGGETWKWFTVKGFEKKEFRDIEAFGEKTAILMSIDTPACILKTVDGGENWSVQFRDSTPGMFLDAMEFWNEQSGIVIGDPMKGRFFVARTFDGGLTWKPMATELSPVADEGEACFASSGTNIRKISKKEAVFVSGGKSSHLFLRNRKIPLPFAKGTETAGANSIALKNKKLIMVAGGDFNKRDSSAKNFFITRDGGGTWEVPAPGPGGYRSCVEYAGKTNWVTCGLNGADYSTDDGRTFRSISKTGYHVCRKAKSGNAVFFAGGGGRIGKLTL